MKPIQDRARQKRRQRQDQIEMARVWCYGIAARAAVYYIPPSVRWKKLARFWRASSPRTNQIWSWRCSSHSRAIREPTRAFQNQTQFVRPTWPTGYRAPSLLQHKNSKFVDNNRVENYSYAVYNAHDEFQSRSTLQHVVVNNNDKQGATETVSFRCPKSQGDDRSAPRSSGPREDEIRSEMGHRPSRGQRKPVRKDRTLTPKTNRPVLQAK